MCSRSVPAASRTAFACRSTSQTGDTIIFSKYGGTEVKYGADEYLILSARDVLAVVQK